jgi:cytochrome oxidase assembly protein ShyY1
MNARAIVVGTVAVVLAAVCVRMSAWQLSRWQEKRALAAELGAALAAPTVPLPDEPARWASVRGRRVRATGEIDSTWVLLLSDRWRGDSAGVEVFSVVRLPGGAAVMLDRGWLPSDDGIHPRGAAPVAGCEREWTALLEPLPAHARAVAWERLGAGPPLVLSARSLALDSLAARAPIEPVSWVLRALPEPGAPGRPERAMPEPPDATMHLSYAVQWACFALAFLAGGWFVASRPRAGGAAARS